MNLSIPKGLIPFIEELRALNIQEMDVHTNITTVSKLIKHWVNRQDWLEDKYFRTHDNNMGYTSRLIHEENDHTLAVYIDTWLAGHGIVPHDHKTWAVIGSVVGTEKNSFWTRIDDGSKPGYAKIRKQNTMTILRAGEFISFLPDDIHSVVNESDTVAVSLHVYGKNLNYTNRFQYDSETNTMKPLILL